VAEFRTVLNECFIAELQRDGDFYGLLDAYVALTHKFLGEVSI
jgi:hypothetical protein